MKNRRTRWYRSLALRLLFIFWALLSVTAASGYLLAVWNKPRAELKPLEPEIYQTLQPLLSDALTFQSLQPGRLIAGDYRVAAQLSVQGSEKLLMDEMLRVRHGSTLLRMLGQSTPQQIPLDERLLMGPFELDGNKILVTKPLGIEEQVDRERRERESTRARLLTLLVGSGLLAVLLGIWLIRPIRRMILAMREVAEGSANPELKRLPKRGDEIGELARALSQAAIDLATSRDAQRRLLSDVSHELRSPMARMQVALDLTETDENDPNWQQLRRDTERLSVIIERILSLSRLENGLVALNHESLDSGELVMQLINDMCYQNPEVRERLIRIESDWPVIDTDPELLRLVLENIVRNALHYTENNVELSCDEQGDGYRIRIRDYGSGVEEDTLEKLFVPFYRGDPARHHKAGVGLGLALSHRAAAVLGGQLKAQNHPEGGLEVVLDLPKSQPERVE
ncbi:HAMP domain-containing sensor histidine kinase [Idiomarina sp. HP20-50]|uniref:HAMP domain-containing sensor histidine kinase n=1 Tax=Idiomarina sp. HP20-50 TaxID=3070813 RepID=UPI00294AD74E|nr:HAMP domain-containing sensor histidine kinase [Idiomarina sp. HP20-50]MDV6316669.1 HAMP domain-containing sensor histidine kinase [Idiomarina sp. HP20-50]